MNIANLVCCTLSFLPFHHRGGHETIYADYSSQAEVVIQHELSRHAPPTVVIRDALPGSTFDGIAEGQALSSADTPSFWSVVPNQVLQVDVKVPRDAFDANSKTGVQLFLDGRQVEKSRSQGVVIEMSAVGQDLLSFPYNFACPSPGKHVVQARYLRNNVWSQLSPPLHFQVRFPQRPKIVSVSDVGAKDFAGPLTDNPVKITGNTLRLTLAGVSATDLINVYLDGKNVGTGTVATGIPAGACCFQIDLAGKLIPGIHDVTVVAIPGGSGCTLASPPSEPVKIHYFVEEHYVLKGGKICDPVTGKCDAEKETTLFAFASAAHFPRRAFGPQGQLVEQQGALIYEGMKIVCIDKNYFLKFRLGTPSVPTTLHLQFQVQVPDNKAWYTITMPPMHFQPEKNKKGPAGEDCCLAREVSCRIDSLVLEACNEKICNMRRTGSARFGFGVEGLGHLAADTE